MRRPACTHTIHAMNHTSQPLHHGSEVFLDRNFQVDADACVCGNDSSSFWEPNRHTTTTATHMVLFSVSKSENGFVWHRGSGNYIEPGESIFLPRRGLQRDFSENTVLRSLAGG